jgi:hypothetical protein
MEEIIVISSKNITKDKILLNKPENNFYKILVYLAIYLSISVIGIIIKYLQEKFSGNKVNFFKI